MTQSKCKIIGITGGIATGKSTVTNFLIDKGYKVIDADKIAREVVEKGEIAYDEIVNYFGNNILKKDGSIDRKKLGEIIFNDQNKRTKLNSIVHPQVIKKIKENINLYSKNNNVLFVDIPLLIEKVEYFKDNNLVFNEIWLVYLKEEEQIKRLIKRDKISLNDSKKRINAQMPIKLKKKYADKIIDNNKDKDYLYEQIIKLLDSLI